ncbi:zinc finger BED domain-containing protein 1 [Elysia marginata]|uniref:Zinc finger BED domain-containing protein 1 n=1 Tax=Elysia marginata TaxID=1093978 RepID=A0AAV4IIE2_9GAST|nr:zinc finger BED domain-containing protein 1 [Elysia marginata]
MLKSCIFQHDQVTTALCLTGKSELCITAEEVAALQAAMETLLSFYEATVELSSELHTSAAKVIPLVFLLQQCLQEDMTELAVVLKGQLHERFRNVNSKDQLRLATLLDPRFKRDGFSHKTFYDEAVDKLKRTAEGISLPATQPVEESAAGSEDAPTPAKKSSVLWSLFDAKRREKKSLSA